MKWTPHRLPDGHYCIAEDTCLSEFMRQSGRLDHDRAFLDRIVSHIRPGTVVIDGGAFLSDHAIAYAKVAKLVLAFEPYWPSYLGLCANVFVGQHFNVCPIHAGLSDRVERIVFGEMPRNVGAISGMGLPLQPRGSVGEVLSWPNEAVTVRLDDQQITEQVGLVKLDIEGFELRALLGASVLIQRNRPIMVLEVNDGALRLQGTSAPDLLALVESLGYRWQPIKGAVGSPCFDAIAFHPENVYP